MAGFLGAVKNLFGKKSNNIVGTIIDGVDRFVTNPDEKHAWELEKTQLRAKIEFEMKQLSFQLEEMYTKDRQSARSTFERKGFLHTVFALTFLVGYFGITGGLLWFIWNVIAMSTGNSLATEMVNNIPSWAAALIGGIFSAMSSKVNTIIDFLFGGSDTKDTSELQITAALQRREEPEDPEYSPMQKKGKKLRKRAKQRET